jgi:hypothetical protein
VQCCYDLKEPCTAECMAYTQVSTMDGPGSVKVICLRLVREHGYISPAQDKAVEDAVGEPTPPSIHSPALEMYR